ncbi:MAG: hypothetical protein JW915_18950 [Chitinispirillaceae bacterium]|nr:hypothetical protein [Chitinispirillaceae bacterium]
MRFKKALFSLLIFILFLSTRSNAQCNTIDAITAASFRITGGEACSTHANLKWSYKENNGTMTIEWGTSTSYGNSKSVYSSNPVKLTGLNPSTTYYYNVTGLWKGRTYPYTRSTFKTSSGSVSVNNPPEITSASAVVCTTGKSLIYKVTANDKDKDPVTFTLSGNKPGWVDFTSPNLVLKPVSGSKNSSIQIVASDGKNGFDTLKLAISVQTPTSVIEPGLQREMITLIAGSSSLLVKASADRLIHVALYSLNGAMIMNKVLDISDGNSKVSLLPDKIISGVYLLNVSNQLQSSMHQICVK